MENKLKEKYRIWIEEEIKIKKQELRLSIYITFVVLGWGLPLIFVENKTTMLSVTPFFLVAYIYILIKLKNLNTHMIGILKEMVQLKNQISLTDENKELISTINGLELYYLSARTFPTFEKLTKK